MIPIGMSYATPEDKALAYDYQQRFGYPLLDDGQVASIRVHIESGQLQIIAPQISRKPYQHILTPSHHLKQHPLRQAIGTKRRNCLIYDLTAGLLKDSLSLVMLGHRVVAVEQHPLVFSLGAQAWQNLQIQHPEFALSLYHATAEDFIHNTPTRPDIVYLDPMFPIRGKTALVKKPMQLLQAIVGDPNQDYGALLTLACQYATSKVIVKRPNHSEPLAGRKPSSQVSQQQSTRYDIYYVS
jgi:16S rRNA (guanine1516-N2)-methyltransferase